MGRLDQRAIIVTGAASDLGREYAVRFAREGARLTIADADFRNVSRTAELCQTEGADVLPLCVDVSSEESMNDMAKQTHERYGRIDGLLNNAGATAMGWEHLARESILDIQPSMLDIAFRECVWGALLGARAVLPAMLKQNSGIVVNLIPEWHNDAVGWALRGITRTVERELRGTNVQVVAVPLQSTSSMEDRTGVLVYFFSDDAQFVNDETRNNRRRSRQRRLNVTEGYSTQGGFENENSQVNLGRTNPPRLGSDFAAYVHVMHCFRCGMNYGSNSTNIWNRACPYCQGGKPGLPLTHDEMEWRAVP